MFTESCVSVASNIYLSLLRWFSTILSLLRMRASCSRVLVLTPRFPALSDKFNFLSREDIRVERYLGVVNWLKLLSEIVNMF